MPLINVIRGERIPAAFTTVHTPVVRVPFWAFLLWWLGRGLGRTVAFAIRHWPVTVPVLVLWWLSTRVDWATVGLILAAALAVGAVWWWAHPATFRRFVGHPLLGRWRRLWRYRRGWAAAMHTCGLATAFNGDRFVPKLVRVRSNGFADVVTVRLLPGQTPDDYGHAADRLAYTFHALDCRVQPDRRPDRIRLVMLRRDRLASIVPPLPVPKTPDLAGLPMAVGEDGAVWRLRLAGTHLLVVGATDAGKGSVLWSLVSALAGGIRAGLVRVWAFDPKGGMELAIGRPLFDRFLYQDPAAMADALEEAVAVMRARADRLRGRTRQHHPTPDDPVYVLIIDELATLTAYGVDRKTKERTTLALALLLSQGRAVGVHVVAALQDPRKDVITIRDLFPTRICLRVTEASHVDLVLGDGARERGALADRIPETLPGVGYVIVAGHRHITRVRFPLHTDEHLTALGRDYGAVTGGQVLDAVPDQTRAGDGRTWAVSP